MPAARKKKSNDVSEAKIRICGLTVLQKKKQKRAHIKKVMRYRVAYAYEASRPEFIKILQTGAEARSIR